MSHASKKKCSSPKFIKLFNFAKKSWTNFISASKQLHIDTPQISKKRLFGPKMWKKAKCGGSRNLLRHKHQDPSNGSIILWGCFNVTKDHIQAKNFPRKIFPRTQKRLKVGCRSLEPTTLVLQNHADPPPERLELRWR